MDLFSRKAEGRLLREDRSGGVFEIVECLPEDYQPLMEMYSVFSPKPASQGLPPADRGVCEKWVRELLEMGENVVALKERKVIGHGALIPDTKGRSAEFVIFVHQAFRNRGIGTQLSAFALEKAKSLGLESVWLTVSVTNSVAMRLYQRLGFQYCDMDDCERIMTIECRTLPYPRA